jgi:hypothetical protein
VNHTSEYAKALGVEPPESWEQILQNFLNRTFSGCPPTVLVPHWAYKIIQEQLKQT